MKEFCCGCSERSENKEVMKVKLYWIRHKNMLRADTYECSNCGAVSGERSMACPYCGKILNGTKNYSDSIDVIELLQETENR